MTDPDEHDGHHDHMFDTPEAAAATELEGEVLIGFVEEATAVVAALAADAGIIVRRVLDLGSGPGVGAGGLAGRFPDARVVAVDSSAVMLERAAARAERLGLAERVETRRIDLADELEAVGPADIVWASMSLHHVGDELATLRQIRGLLAPDGLVALLERHGPTRVLPENVDLGRPGIWERLDTAWADWFQDMRADLPGSSESGEYPAMLEAAGFDVAVDEVMSVDLDPPLDESGRRFALRQVTQARHQLDGRADRGDLEALDRLLDENGPEGVLHRPDVLIRATRRLYVGRPRPTVTRATAR